MYSADPKEGFLTEHGIEKIRSGFANDIYADELHHIYAQQTDVRDKLKQLSADLMQRLSEQIAANTSTDAEMLRLALLLSRQLSNAKGKKQYGYLKPEVKRTVDTIFIRIAADDTIRQIYSLWCDMEQAKHDVYSSAKVQFPDLTDNPQFKSVKNMIVKTVAAMQIAPPSEPDFAPPVAENEDVPVEIPPDSFDFEGEFTAEGVSYKIEWSEAYKQACKLFYKKNKTDAEKQECLRLFQAEADAGNVLAIHDLGKLFGSPFFGEPDAALSADYYRQALTGFLELEDFVERMKPYLQYRIGKMFAYGLGTDIDIARGVRFYLQAADQRNQWAEYQLGKLFLFGADGIEPDWGQAVDWLTRSAEDGNEYAEQMLRHLEDYQNRLLADTIFGLFVNVGRVIEEDYDRTGRVIQSRVDSKLRRAIRRKKMELGIKEDNTPKQSI